MPRSLFQVVPFTLIRPAGAGRGLRRRSLIFLLVGLPLAGLGQVLVDVATHGVPSQNTSHGSGLYPAEHAVDGDLHTFNHTDTSSPDNAWELDFDETYPIGQVDIIPRDCCSGRLSGAVLRLYDDELESIYQETILDPGPLGTFTAVVPDGTIARHVRIGFENGTVGIVHLAEVRVMARIGRLPVIDEWTATPGSITSGMPSVLSWHITDAEGAEIVDWGPVSLSDQTMVAPTASTVYVLGASNQYGSVFAATSIVVDGATLPPRISEFSAAPAEGPDWIEIWNPGPNPVNLSGYHLSDDPLQPTRWTFPEATVVSPGDLLVVGAGAARSEGGLFTPFALSRSDGSLVELRTPQGDILSRFIYPEQRTGFSYGSNLDRDEIYFPVPTPGRLNRGAITLGFLDPPVFSVERGFHAAPFPMAITSSIPGAVIYVTTDGSTPSPTGPTSLQYSQPIQVSSTTVVRAVATMRGHVDSWPTTHSYLFLDEVIAQPMTVPGFPTQWLPDGASGALAPIPLPSDYEMDPAITGQTPFFDLNGEMFDTEDALRAVPTFCLTLPTSEMWDPQIGLHANARKRGREWERTCSLEIIDSRQGICSQTGCGLRIHGGRTRVDEMMKKSFRLYFRREYGAGKLDYPLFAGQPEDGFDHLVLRAGTGKTWASPWRDLTGPGNSLERVTNLRDQFLRDSQRDMGHPSIGGGFVHLYINGLYWGLYNPVERPGGDFAAAYFGGEEDDYDVLQWANGLAGVAVNGDRSGWDEILALSRGAPADPATYAAIGDRLNLEQFVDHLLLNFVVGNDDWVLNNSYAFRPRTGDTRFRFLCWDGEEIFNSISKDATGYNRSDSHMEVHQDLRANPDYRMLFADRTYQHLVREDGAVNTTAMQHRLTGLAETIDRAVVAETARWGDLLRPDEPYTREQHWLPEIRHELRDYLVRRPITTLAQLRADALYPAFDPPRFVSREGGEVPVDYRLELAPPDGLAGVIYYTLDGTDPRATGGGVSGSAVPYDKNSSVNLPGDVVVKARMLIGNAWSALTEAAFTIAGLTNDLVVSEIMYHPSDPTPSESAAGITDEGLFEYIEIRNVGSHTRNLADVSFTQGVRFSFRDSAVSSLSPGGTALVAAHETAFLLRYGGGLPIAGVWGNGARLENAGERITLAHDTAGPIRDFVYDDVWPWPSSPDGDGHSLVLIDPVSRPDHTNPLNWRPSLARHGTPGTSDHSTFNGDPQIDADGDGLPAYLEYALGTSDANPLSGPGVLQFTTMPDRHLSLDLPLNLLAEDVELTLQSSTNLVDWAGADPTLVKARIIHHPGGTASVTYRTRSPATTSPWFLRLRLKPR